jgi:macrolide-specific efflux system membrane fusion protein
MKKKYYIIISIVLFVVIAVVLGMFVFSGGGKKESKIETAIATRRDIGSTVIATGIIKPMVGAEVKIGSRISGVVKKLKANIGDYVQAGQIIAELDDAELQAKLNQNVAALNKAKADYEYAQLNIERQKSLLQQNFISQQQVDIAETSFKVAEAQLKQAEANVDFAKVQLSYTKIFATTSGVIASVSTQEGETVSASLASPTFVSIIDLKRLEVNAYVDETDIGKIKVGQEASFTVDTYSDSDFRGKITAIYPKAVIQDNVVNYIVTIKITDFQNKILRPEMTTNVTLYLETRKNVLTIPTSAIKRDKGERFVTVIEGDKKVQRKVKIGWNSNSYTEIVNGLTEGEKVVVSE